MIYAPGRYYRGMPDALCWQNTAGTIRTSGWRQLSEGREWRLVTPMLGEPVWVADKTQSFNAWVALTARVVQKERRDMNISAQVIDTIVEWIDDNLHQPLRIDDIARHAGYSKWHLQRLFLQYKGESLGRYIRERQTAAGGARPARYRPAGL